MVKGGSEADKEVVDYCRVFPVAIPVFLGLVPAVGEDGFDDVSIVLCGGDLFGTALFSAPDTGYAVAASGLSTLKAFQRMKERCKVGFLQRDGIVFREGNYYLKRNVLKILFLFMKNIRITVEYDGTSFAGWQRQSGALVTVQGEIERVLGKILQERVSLAAAGRTDKGVHARAQTANFFTASILEPSRIVHSLNALLPKTVRITDPVEVDMDFHARHSARQRQYRYFLLEEPSAIYGRFAGCSFGKLDLSLMQQLAALLVGRHDFSAFSRENRDNPGRICTVTACQWYREKDFMVLRISADRFLRSMVRYLVDAMIQAGKGVLSAEEFSRMLESGVMTSQLNPALPGGLFLWKVSY